VEKVLLPPVSLSPSRKDDLWKATCFEFFLAVGDQPGYWEFNLSPSGDWNVYRMDAYRKVGFRIESGLLHLPFEMKKEAEAVSLDVSADLSSIVQAEAELNMGITAVIQTSDGNETYWALTHPGTQADFHLRDSFILRLAGRTHPSGQSAPGD
jgi:hypothetical protein